MRGLKNSPWSRDSNQSTSGNPGAVQRETCKKDRSIAIAHGLEDLCEVPAATAKGKGKRGRRMSAWPADFLDAFRRHWDDGELLRKKCRWPNADHLYGMAAECGLKAVMVRLGMDVDTRGVPTERDHKVHIDKLWDVFRSFADRRQGANYATMLTAENPFDDWSVTQRYAHRTNFTKCLVDAHRVGANKVRNLVNTAKNDGII